MDSNIAQYEMNMLQEKYTLLNNQKSTLNCSLASTDWSLAAVCPYTVTDRRTLLNIIGWEGRVTDDDPVCCCVATILIQESRLRDSLLLSAVFPRVTCFTGSKETLPVFTILLFCMSLFFLLIHLILSVFPFLLCLALFYILYIIFMLNVKLFSQLL